MNPTVQPRKWLWLPSHYIKSLHFFTGFSVVKHRRNLKIGNALQRDSEARSRKGCCRGKAISITYSRCVCVFLPQLSGNQSASAVLYCHLLPDWLCHINPLNAYLNPICHFLALLAHPILHVSRIRVNTVSQPARLSENKFREHRKYALIFSTCV